MGNAASCVESSSAATSVLISELKEGEMQFRQRGQVDNVYFEHAKHGVVGFERIIRRNKKAYIPNYALFLIETRQSWRRKLCTDKQVEQVQKIRQRRMLPESEVEDAIRVHLAGCADVRHATKGAMSNLLSHLYLKERLLEVPFDLELLPKP